MPRPDGQPYQSRVATTGPAGFALQNGTPVILTWTAPADGLQHAVDVYLWKRVATTETGGAVAVAVTQSGGSKVTNGTAAFAGGAANADYPFAASTTNYMVNSGGTIEVDQTSALTGGASTVFGELWASNVT